MRSADILIVGGGPAGSSCAFHLRRWGLKVLLIDRARFPRFKPCAGWITPKVWTLAGADPRHYASTNTLEPIHAFRVSILGRRPTDVDYGRTVSYGILRTEFDEFLLRRCGATVVEDTPVREIRRVEEDWVVNGEYRARYLVGAGGHFCPVARLLAGAKTALEPAVVARVAELECSDQDAGHGVPELYFLPDLSGYGWKIRKGNRLNIGIGSLKHEHFAACCEEFCRMAGVLESDLPHFKGHAYLLAGDSMRLPNLPNVFLAGDAAGVAHSSSGEGIVPAMESGMAVAHAIVEGLPAAETTPVADRSKHTLPDILSRFLAGTALSNAFLARHFVLNPLFLRD